MYIVDLDNGTIWSIVGGVSGTLTAYADIII